MSHCWFSWQGCPSQLHCGQQRSVPHWSSLVKRAPVWPWAPSSEEDLHHSAWKGLLQKSVISDVEKSLLWTLSSHDIWPISAQRSAVDFYYSSDLAAALIYRNNAHSISFFWSGGQKYNSTHMFVFLGLGISQIQNSFIDSQGLRPEGTMRTSGMTSYISKPFSCSQLAQYRAQ